MLSVAQAKGQLAKRKSGWVKVLTRFRVMKALPLPEASKPTFSGNSLSEMSMSNHSF